MGSVQAVLDRLTAIIPPGAVLHDEAVSVGSRMTPNKKSSGVISGLEAAAAIPAFVSAVFLLGVPRWRPPRLSPGLDPLGITTFATVATLQCERQVGGWRAQSFLGNALGGTNTNPFQEIH